MVGGKSCSHTKLLFFSIGLEAVSRAANRSSLFVFGVRP
jgi:hypothetical protein